MVLLGPPRSGKGLHFAIPMILDAPGAVITTSTRPDNLAVTLTARADRGPVAVFDPQHLAAIFVRRNHLLAWTQTAIHFAVNAARMIGRWRQDSGHDEGDESGHGA